MKMNTRLLVIIISIVIFMISASRCFAFFPFLINSQQQPQQQQQAESTLFPNLNLSKLEPIVFIPGLGGSALHARLANLPDPPLITCATNDNDGHRLWVSLLQFVPRFTLECFLHNMRPVINQSTGEISSTPGVTIQPVDFGGLDGVKFLAQGFLKGVTSYLAQMAEYFTLAGYREGVNFRAATYDFRTGPRDWLASNGSFSALKFLIEQTFDMNNCTPVHLIGHSMGAPYATQFLANYVSDEWKAKHIKTFISLAGAFGGSPLTPSIIGAGATYDIPTVTPNKLRTIQSNMASMAWMFPLRERWKDNPILKTQTKTYTLGNVEELYTDAGFKEASILYKVGQSFNRLLSPRVETHCIYGVDSPTPNLYFVDNVQSTNEIRVLEFVNGDDTIPLEDLVICDEFKRSMEQPVHVHRISRGGHRSLVSNEFVFRNILNITTSGEFCKKLRL